MLLNSARGLKQHLTETVLTPFAEAGHVAKSFGLPTGQMAAASDAHRSIALGVARKSAADFQLAVRVQRAELMGGKEIEKIRKQAKDEVDVQFIGRVSKRAGEWNRQRHRPLQIGVSVGHVKVTAGTLGAFVRKRGTDTVCILSNNHVLANENRARAGDAVLQPGAFDGGVAPADIVTALAGMVRMKKKGANVIDAAIAQLAAGQEYDARTIRGLGKLAGLGAEFVDVGTAVAKLGRTTGLTRGRVTAFELDNVVVGYEIGNLRFDNQLEIEGAGDKPFSQGGDSGSLIVEADTRLAVALLFAGTDLGGANNKGLTYANPLRAVLDALQADLVAD